MATNIPVYIEAHERIAELIDGMDMSDWDEVAGSRSGNPSDEVIQAMYAIGRAHEGEAKALKAEEKMLEGIHGNLIAPGQD
jgi:hypothetical protein